MQVVRLGRVEEAGGREETSLTAATSAMLFTYGEMFAAMIRKQLYMDWSPGCAFTISLCSVTSSRSAWQPRWKSGRSTGSDARNGAFSLTAKSRSPLMRSSRKVHTWMSPTREGSRRLSSMR